MPARKNYQLLKLTMPILQLEKIARFFDEAKPVHSVLAGQMLSQGVLADPLLGPIVIKLSKENHLQQYLVSALLDDQYTREG